MKVIGLIGGVCSGKTTACKILEQMGVTIINADKLTHDTYLPGTDCYNQVVATFGSEIIYSKDKTIDRKVLSNIVFSDVNKLRELESIVWPCIETKIKKQINDLKEKGDVNFVVVEAAMLLEAGWHQWVDEVWTIEAHPQTCIERMMSRNSFSLEECKMRLAMQMTNEERKKIASKVIKNENEENELKHQLSQLAFSQT